MMRHVLTLGLAIVLCVGATVWAGPTIPDDVREQVKTLVDEGICTGVIVGVVDESGTTFFGAGKSATENGRPVDENTIFEIGSISKVFTSILLCELVESGKVALDDPVEKYLPEGVKVPERNGKKITLRMLATHHSGLPRMPDNFNPKDPANPYVDYTEKDLFAFLATCELQRDPGSKYEYSNLGAGLLGVVVSRVAGKPYATLLHDGITGPLGLEDTSVHVPTGKRNRFAEGHELGKPVAHWEFDALAGAGAIRSTAKDMLRFLAFNMGLKSSPIDKALMATQTPRTDTGNPDLQIALGWHVWNKFGTEIIWHNGGTAGFHSFCGFRKDKKLGVVVFVNDSRDMNPIGLHVLEPKFELEKIRKSIDLSRKELEPFVGWYLKSETFRMHITLDGDRLNAELTGQPVVPVYPVAKNRFIYRVVDAELEFDRGDKGEPTAVTLHQNGQSFRFERAPAGYTPPPSPPTPKVVQVDAKVLQQYVGRYRMAPNAVFDVTLEKDQLMVRLTGQQAFPVYPESETEFFYKVVQARITFVKDKSGKVVSLVLHQSGINMPAEKFSDDE